MNKGQLALIAYNRRQKGKTYLERFGKSKGTVILRKHRKALKEVGKRIRGVSYEERYGPERAQQIKEKLSISVRAHFKVYSPRIKYCPLPKPAPYKPYTSAAYAAYKNSLFYIHQDEIRYCHFQKRGEVSTTTV